MVGGMLAAALAHSLNPSSTCPSADAVLKIAVLEPRAPAPFDSASTHDLRVSALSLASERMLRAVGAWDGITRRRCCAFSRMQVWDGEKGGETSFYSGDLGHTHLGHIVENRVLQLALAERLEDFPNVDWLCPASLDSLATSPEHVTVTLDDSRQLTARLLVGADGANSRVRRLCNIESKKFTYPQHALVASIATTLPQQSVTWQRFLPTGPQAFLPLSGNNASMVWYHNEDEIARLMALPDKACLEAMEDAFPSELGGIATLYGRGSFPLASSHAQHYVQERVALTGDAAHTVHPLAGQGVNLGLLDAAVLAEAVRQASRAHRDIGRLTTLRRYERWRRGENQLMISALDAFYHAFKPQPAALQQLRSLAMNVADRVSPVKNLVTAHAMGIGGDLPLLAKGHLP